VGAERRLARVAAELERLAAERAAPALAGLAADLGAARRDLAQFARGVHPRTLTERGLPAALEELAEQAALPVELDLAAVDMPAAQEAALYFVCSEALANVAKYAHASVARISVATDNGRLRIQVTDDGKGGADPAAGSGLRGLADRVEALGGHLFVESENGNGTRVAAVLPLAET
jgi:signal transduction histidine kinase